jgi:segregation and condensation protein A
VDLTVADGTVSREGFLVIEVERFQGPLDLLLHLIRTQDIDVFDIPIAKITDQFLQAIRGIQAQDLDGAGEFLEMAATLIRIKAQMLLPKAPEDAEDEADPREQLVRKLVEYRQFKEAASSLARSEEERRDHFAHGSDPRAYADLADEGVETEEFLRDVTLFDLVDALREVLARIPRRIDVHTVDIEQVTVEERMDWIRTMVGSRGTVTFRALFEGAPTRAQVVATFIALLELIRLGAVAAAQNRAFGEIVVSSRTEV